MQLRSFISAMLLTYWVVKVFILSMVRTWVAESFPMRHRLSWDDDAQCADSFGRPAFLAVMISAWLFLLLSTNRTYEHSAH